MSESLYRKASLVMNPYGALDGELPSIKPTDGSGDFTFSRDGAGASPATRVNASGLIEKGRTNELLQSNTFSTTWTNASSSETGGQSGYDGSNDAWLLTSTTSGGRISQSVSVSGVQTFSVYLKAGSRNWGLLVSTSTSAYFDLVNGVVGSGGTAPIDANIESVGGGWYRCSITANGSNAEVRIYPALDDNDVSGSGSIYMQDAQLESGLVATDYIATTTAPVSAGLLGDMPRLDYSGGATCPSLLLEPSRVNSFTQSEYFSALMTLDAGATIDVNAETSPEGVQNAARLNFNVASKSMYRAVSFAGEHAYSFYVKAEGSNIGKTFNFRLRDTSNVAVNHAVPLTGEWVRHDFQFSDANLMEFTNREGTTIDTGGFLLWGIQIESGSYPTSYIPSYGQAAAAQRGADACVNTSASAIIGQTEGTLYAEVDFDAISEESRFVQISDGTNNNRMYIGVSSTNTIDLYLFSGGAGVVSISSSAYTSQVVKVAAAYANNDFVLYVNGTQIGTDTTGSVPAMDEVSISYNNIANNRHTAYGTKQAVLFPTRLTNAELAALTA